MQIRTKLYSQLDCSTSRLHLLVLISFLAVGFLLRLYGYWVGESFHIFAINDEVSAFRVAMQFLAGEEQAFYLGQPNFSEGHAPGPGWTLFWVVLLKLGGGSIDYALLYVALLNSLVVFLIYLFARQLLSPGYALLSCVLFAISPWPVYYSLGLWNPVPLALIGVLLFISLWRVTQIEKSYAIFWVCVLSAILPHFHMIGVFYYPAILLVLYLSPVKLNRGGFIIGLIAGMLVYAPYFVGEIQHDWENTRLILSGNEGFTFSVLKVISGPVTVLSNHPGRWLGDGLDGLFKFGDIWFGSRYVLLAVNVVSLLLSLFIVVWFGRHFFALSRRYGRQWGQMFKNYPVVSFVGILLFLPLLLFVFTGHNYSTRYAILIFPLLFVLPALYLEFGQSGQVKKFYVKSLPLVSVFSIYLLLTFFTHLSNQAEGDEHFINSFRKMELIREKVKQHAGQGIRIQLVIDEYAKQAPERLMIAVVALADYFNIYNVYIDKNTNVDVNKYVLRYQKDVITDSGTVAYQGNGIVVYLSSKPADGRYILP